MLPQKIDEITPAQKISAKLRGLGVNGFSVGEPMIGPIITSYPVKLSTSTSIKVIINKSEDIAISLGVESVDIRRIGTELIIFVPNSKRKVVDFKTALFWYLKDEKVKEMQVPILIGTDFHGYNAAIDLADQPHILIAGSTGSGKSIFESSIIAALATLKNEKELKLCLVDTKNLDLTLFENLPQTKMIARTAEDWYRLSNYLYNEVQNRNKHFERHQTRNIKEFNTKSIKKMPYIVVVIDELADLIEKDKLNIQEKKALDEFHGELKVIDSIKRIIQICRAAGVFIIACTQRTSVDIVSGTVKANFPTRISLRLPTKTDSRTILDQNGAENLLGKGDMLIKRNDSDNLERYHSPFVKLEDIKAILDDLSNVRESLGLIG